MAKLLYYVMKELKLAEVVGTTAEISNNSFVGVDFGNEKVAIIRSARNEYVGMTKDLDAENSWEASTVRDYAERALEFKESKIYLFDNAKELLTWLTTK